MKHIKKETIIIAVMGIILGVETGAIVSEKVFAADNVTVEAEAEVSMDDINWEKVADRFVENNMQDISLGATTNCSKEVAVKIKKKYYGTCSVEDICRTFAETDENYCYRIAERFGSEILK